MRGLTYVVPAPHLYNDIDSVFGRRLALEKATANAELSEHLGLPLTSGPWYNASIGLTHRDYIANCQLTVVGSKHSSDIYTRVSTSAHSILQLRLLCTNKYTAGYLGMLFLMLLLRKCRL